MSMKVSAEDQTGWDQWQRDAAQAKVAIRSEVPVFYVPTVYIAGPMRGQPKLNYPAFDAAKKDWQAAGWNVVSPADLDREHGDGLGDIHEDMGNLLHEEAYRLGNTPWVRRDVEVIMALKPGRDMVVLLPGWEGSKGAKAEAALAQWREVEVRSASNVIAVENHNLWTGLDKVKEEIRVAAGIPNFEPTKANPIPAEPTEAEIILETFTRMLRAVTADGARKRARGEKPPWWRDPSHEPAIFSHLNKWKHGEVRDPDSGVHPLVHLAWRALAIAYQESHGKRDPVEMVSLDLPLATVKKLMAEPGSIIPCKTPDCRPAEHF